MKTYPIPMVPGPVKAHPAVMEAYRLDYGSADLEAEYLELYTRTEANLKRLLYIGYTLFPAPGAVPAPTVTAVNVPEGIGGPEFDRRRRRHGLVVGGSYGPIAGKVFRLGHMGTQADMGFVSRARRANLVSRGVLTVRRSDCGMNPATGGTKLGFYEVTHRYSKISS